MREAGNAVGIRMSIGDIVENLSQDVLAGERQKAGVLFGRGMAAVITVSFGFIWMAWGFSALPAFRAYEWECSTRLRWDLWCSRCGPYAGAGSN